MSCIILSIKHSIGLFAQCSARDSGRFYSREGSQKSFKGPNASFLHDPSSDEGLVGDEA